MIRFPFRRAVPPVLLLLMGVGIRVGADEPKKAPPTKEQIAQWIHDLGDDNFDQRQNASKRLWEAGRLAEQGLKEAVKGNDPEVKRRSRELLDKFVWGIYPDTPAKTVEMIQRYRGAADVDAKGAIIPELLDDKVDGQAAFARISTAEDKELLGLVFTKAAQVFVKRANGWHKKKDYDRAIKECDQAIRLAPKYDWAFICRGEAWSNKKEYDKAIKDYDEAIRLDPSDPGAYCDRGLTWTRKRDYDRAVKDYDEALRLNPDLVVALNNKAFLLGSCPNDKFRDGKKALELATKACDLTRWETPLLFDALAVAYAETGQFDKAVEWVKKALEDKEYEKEYGDETRERLKLFEEKTPFREK